MPTPRTRAFRRRKQARKVQEALSRLRNSWMWNFLQWDGEDLVMKIAHRNAVTPKRVQGCFCCCKVRKHEGPPTSERRRLAREHDNYDE